MSQLLEAHSRSEIVDELAYVTEHHTLVDVHICPEGQISWVSFVNNLGTVVRLSYDGDES